MAAIENSNFLLRKNRDIRLVSYSHFEKGFQRETFTMLVDRTALTFPVGYTRDIKTRNG